MKAIVQERYGSPDDLELREVEKPVVGDDDVLVRVRAVSVHPDVWHVVRGRPYVLRLMGAGFFRPKNPIPGTDVAGIVESVGKGVSRFRAGDPVFGETIATQQWTNGGAFAEYVSVPQDLLALKPDHITFEQAASVPTSGYIALLEEYREVRRPVLGAFRANAWWSCCCWRWASALSRGLSAALSVSGLRHGSSNNPRFLSAHASPSASARPRARIHVSSATALNSPRV